jgi:hypothetical protein
MTDRRKLPDRPPDEGQDSGRERISRAAYDLFSREGVRAVGKCRHRQEAAAKMTLYRNFHQDDLIIEPCAAASSSDPGSKSRARGVVVPARAVAGDIRRVL